MMVRRASAGDLAAVRAIAESYGNLEEWPRRPDYLDHELERGALWVALEGAEVVGFAGVLVDGDVAHLADAFIRRTGSAAASAAPCWRRRCRATGRSSRSPPPIPVRWRSTCAPGCARWRRCST
jgi:hypothetical protein